MLVNFCCGATVVPPADVHVHRLAFLICARIGRGAGAALRTYIIYFRRRCFELHWYQFCSSVFHDGFVVTCCCDPPTPYIEQRAVFFPLALSAHGIRSCIIDRRACIIGKVHSGANLPLCGTDIITLL